MAIKWKVSIIEEVVWKNLYQGNNLRELKKEKSYYDGYSPPKKFL